MIVRITVKEVGPRDERVLEVRRVTTESHKRLKYMVRQSCCDGNFQNSRPPLLRQSRSAPKENFSRCTQYDLLRSAGSTICSDSITWSSVDAVAESSGRMPDCLSGGTGSTPVATATGVMTPWEGRSSPKRVQAGSNPVTPARCEGRAWYSGWCLGPPTR